LLLDVRLERRARVPPERHHALLAALAEDGHEARGEVHLRPAQPGRLRNPEAAGIEQLEQRPVAEPETPVVRRGQEASDLARAERVRAAGGRAADAYGWGHVV